MKGLALDLARLKRTQDDLEMTYTFLQFFAIITKTHLVRFFSISDSQKFKGKHFALQKFGDALEVLSS